MPAGPCCIQPPAIAADDVQLADFSPDLAPLPTTISHPDGCTQSPSGRHRVSPARADPDSGPCKRKRTVPGIDVWILCKAANLSVAWPHVVEACQLRACTTLPPTH